MKIISIDYKKHFWNDGTVYRQLVKIDKELMDKYNEFLQLEYDRINYYKNLNKTITNHDMDILSYTEKLNKWINYIKLTWLYYFWIVQNIYKLDKKNRLFWNRNTIIEVL